MPDFRLRSGPAAGQAGIVMRMRARAAGTGAVVVAAAAIAFLMSSFGPAGSSLGPAVAHACGEELAAKYRVKSRFPKLYAKQYKKRMKVQVTTKHGPLVAWQVQLYTFQGKLLGKTKRMRKLNDTRTAKVKLKFPIQPGKFTLVVKGYPRGCHAESTTSDVVRFRGCTKRLPVKFPDKPGGAAGDYGGFLSVPVETRRGALIRRPETEIYSFSGEFFGRSINRDKVLFGRLTFDNKLTKPLRPGSYTVIAYGRVDQPRSCGDKTRTTELEFD